MSRHATGVCVRLAVMHAALAVGCGPRPETSPAQSPPIVRRGRSEAAPEPGGQAVASGQEIAIGFTGRVERIEPLGLRELAAIPVHFDPMFALTVRVDSVDQEKTPITAGKTTVFAIHSPTLLFAEDAKAVIGRTFGFRVVWHTGPPARFSGLALAPFRASAPRDD